MIVAAKNQVDPLYLIGKLSVRWVAHMSQRYHNVTSQRLSQILSSSIGKLITVLIL
jgi:hypothetical protein